MKKIIIGLCTALCIAQLGYGQKDNTDIDLVQSMFGRSKRLLVEDYIQLNDKEKNSFWRLYDEYEEKRKVIEKQSLVLVKEYAANYETMDSTEAHKLIMIYMKSMDEYNALHKTYFRKMEKALGSLKAATFIQLETFIEVASQANLQSQLPVIGELKLFDTQNIKPYTEN